MAVRVRAAGILRESDRLAGVQHTAKLSSAHATISRQTSAVFNVTMVSGNSPHSRPRGCRLHRTGILEPALLNIIDSGTPPARLIASPTFPRPIQFP